MPSVPRVPTIPDAGSRPPMPSGAGLGESDVDALTPEETVAVYEDLMSNTKKLSGAVDTGVRFDMDGAATVACSGAGCTVTANVSSSASANSGGKVTGQVNASMTANVTIGGRAAGSCRNTATLPLNGTGSISCVNSGAGGVFSAVEAEKKADAEAQSRASGGVPVQYRIESIAAVSVTAEAIGQVEITRLVDELSERRSKLGGK
ncbi:hypothetical protein GCM10027598_36000 [Amycolatopsis oliviviridis]|uniref:Uncharacterized protein n=1 Tax=Amycolatopsis oliviviridis TaxID=1471590 RepID=A0ABQ3LHP2_9PSEU|nr:hypothetical protein [Amycolatopsis oliviviridis]GHH13264.1 hypothetical protein GCM10017790_25830 [Amycolatopsis oliviviridis]